CRKRGKALTTGFINIALNAGAHFSEYRNLRIPLMLLPTIFNRVRVSLRGVTWQRESYQILLIICG
ncbi:hypothetical protein M1742_23810, partial [Salmonella enterica subsp. enterica serovar Typhimurium]|uniref:hypothetical protein n=4 Tax=Enterobacterales TaxID=91347 RepID=UPI000A7FE70C